MGRYFTGNGLQSISLENLAKISAHLRSRFDHDVDLPEGLLYDDSLWPTLGDLRTWIFVGYHTTGEEKGYTEAWISPRDHKAQLLLTSKLERLHPKNHNLVDEQLVEFARGADSAKAERCAKEARRVFVEKFSDLASLLYPDDKEVKRALKLEKRILRANIIIGSQKVNYLLNLFVASLYGHEEPFSQSKTQPCIPFFLLARDTDSDIKSCFGSNVKPDFIPRVDPEPGIYYYDAARDSWDNYVSWRSNKQDAGMVIVRHNTEDDVLDLALFGFTGAGTLLLSQYIIDNGDMFWDLDDVPSRNGKPRKSERLGAWVCRIPLDETLQQSMPPVVNTDMVEKIETLKLPTSI